MGGQQQKEAKAISMPVLPVQVHQEMELVVEQLQTMREPFVSRQLEVNLPSNKSKLEEIKKEPVKQKHKLGDLKLKKVRDLTRRQKQNENAIEDIQDINTKTQKIREFAERHNCKRNDHVQLMGEFKTAPVVPVNSLVQHQSETRSRKFRISKML